MNGQTNNLITFSRQIYSGIKELKHLSLSSLRKVFSLMGKKEKIIFFSLLVISLISLFVSLKNFYVNHTQPAPTFGGSYTEGMKGQPLYINPLLAFQEPDLSLVKLIYSGLYKIGSQGQLLPDLAEGLPQISQDQKQYTINLKRNAKWHNGKDLTAEDVVFTIETLKNPDFKSPLRPLWLATSVEKLSDYQLRFTTKDVSGPFIYNLTLPILPKNVWGKIDAQKFLLSSFNLSPIGSGPFAVKEVSSQKNSKVQKITFQSFSNFHLGKPKLDNISIRFYDNDENLMEGLLAKEIQGFGYIASGNEEFAVPKEIQKLTAPLPQYQMVFFNLNSKILAEQNFRQALAQSINQKQLLAEVLKNEAILPSLPLLLENGQNFRPSLPEYNPQNAKQILEKNGWILDANTNLRTKKGATAELTLATNDSPVNARTAQFLADTWKETGIKINLEILPTRQLTEDLIKPRKFDILIFPQKLGADPDPFVLWHSSQIKNPGLNLTGFENQQTDKLINDGRNTTNQKLRDEKYLQFYSLLNEKLPAIFLSQAQFVYLVSNEIKNISLKTIYEPSMRFYDAPNWYTETKRVWK